jgi:hypothetical protein
MADSIVLPLAKTPQEYVNELNALRMEHVNEQTIEQIDMVSLRIGFLRVVERRENVDTLITGLRNYLNQEDGYDQDVVVDYVAQIWIAASGNLPTQKLSKVGDKWINEVSDSGSDSDSDDEDAMIGCVTDVVYNHNLENLYQNPLFKKSTVEPLPLFFDFTSNDSAFSIEIVALSLEQFSSMLGDIYHWFMDNQS